MDEKQPEYHLYEIKVEATVPCRLSYRVRATNPEEALKLIEKQGPSKFEPYLPRRKFHSATVYNSGTINVQATRKYH